MHPMPALCTWNRAPNNHECMADMLTWPPQMVYCPFCFFDAVLALQQIMSFAVMEFTSAVAPRNFSVGTTLFRNRMALIIG